MHLIDEERPQVVEVVHWAASNGDRSENGDYIYGKKRLREIDRRIRFLTKRLEIAEVVDPAVHHGSEQVFFGATVHYAEESGQERTVTIMGIDEADSAQGQVSWISPIARALLKATAGDVVRLATPAGVQEIEFLVVRYPAPGALRRKADRPEPARCTRSTDGVRRSVRITASRCARSRTAITKRRSVASCGFSSRMSTCVMSASALATATATRASTPFALVTVTITLASNGRTGSSDHSTPMKRSLSRLCSFLATAQSSQCTTSPSPRPR